MPLVDGDALGQSVRKKGPLESRELVRIMADTARALDHAHNRDVTHGNLHPKHILLDRNGNVSLIGFAEVSQERPANMMFGNPHHLAPEQCESYLTLPASDVYALVEVAYLGLCGSFPFAGDHSAMDLFTRKRSGPIPSVREHRPELSKRIDEILQRGLAIRPEERYASAGDFARAFSTALR